MAFKPDLYRNWLQNLSAQYLINEFLENHEDTSSAEEDHSLHEEAEVLGKKGRLIYKEMMRRME